LATNKLENPKTHAVMKGKVIESNGKRAGKVAFMNEPQHQIIQKLGKISAEATDLSMEMAEMPQVS